MFDTEGKLHAILASVAKGQHEEKLIASYVL
jgi:hypothetical protein